jgi:hypothetical protein
LFCGVEFDAYPATHRTCCFPCKRQCLGAVATAEAKAPQEPLDNAYNDKWDRCEALARSRGLRQGSLAMGTSFKACIRTSPSIAPSRPVREGQAGGKQNLPYLREHRMDLAVLVLHTKGEDMTSTKIIFPLIAALFAGVGFAQAQSQAPELPPAAAGHTTPGTAQRPATSGAGMSTQTPSAPNTATKGDRAMPAPIPGSPANERSPANR